MPKHDGGFWVALLRLRCLWTIHVRTGKALHQRRTIILHNTTADIKFPGSEIAHIILSYFFSYHQASSYEHTAAIRTSSSKQSCNSPAQWTRRHLRLPTLQIKKILLLQGISCLPVRAQKVTLKGDV